jgi:hypothetical protein
LYHVCRRPETTVVPYREDRDSTPRVVSDEQIIAGGVDVAVTGTSRTTICTIHLAQSGGLATDSEGRDTACFDLVDSVEVSLVGMYREEGGILRDRCTGTANDRNGVVR